MAEALDAGHAKFWLEGSKLVGGWTLHRTRGAKPQWLLIKRRDEGPTPRNPELQRVRVRQDARTL